MKKFVLLILVSIVLQGVNAQGSQTNKLTFDTLCYAIRNNVKLNVEIISSKNIGKENPAIIFFFGGGWLGGSRDQFRPQAEYLANKGIITILADYRTKKLGNATPFNCVEDAKSAIRFIKENSKKLKIDTTKIVTSGGSAGGHLAAACAYVSHYNHPDDNLSISSRPSALILFNPVIDNGENGYGFERIKDEYVNFSPLHNLKNNNALPTIFMVGSKDRYVPTETAEKYKLSTEENGAKCILKIYEEQKHGFFNYKKNGDNTYYDITLKEAEKFLNELGYIK